jgi:hypothetical protein
MQVLGTDFEELRAALRVCAMQRERRAMKAAVSANGALMKRGRLDARLERSVAPTARDRAGER